MVLIGVIMGPHPGAVRRVFAHPSADSQRYTFTVFAALIGKEDPRTWQMEGKQDIWQVANEKARAILAKHRPEYIDRKVDAKIRKALNILMYSLATFMLYYLL